MSRVDGEQAELLVSLPTQRASGLFDAGALANVPPLPAYVCSVVEEVLPLLLPLIQDRTGSRPLVFGRDLPLPVPLDYETPETLGADRVLAAYAAFCEFPGGALVADAGSALTVDWIDGTGTFRGGAIAPGLAALGRALKEAAPGLEWVAPDTAVRWPGRTTTDCVKVGVTAAARGLLEGLFRDAFARAGEDVPVVATGGGARLLGELLPDLRSCHRPHLLATGIARAAEADLQHG